MATEILSGAFAVSTGVAHVPRVQSGAGSVGAVKKSTLFAELRLINLRQLSTRGRGLFRELRYWSDIWRLERRLKRKLRRAHPSPVEKAQQRAAALARELLFIRVVLPRPSTEQRKQRRREQVRDLFQQPQALLRRQHESELTRSKENALGLSHALHFHSTHADDDYGSFAIVCKDLDRDHPVEALPFGSGGLLCEQGEGCPDGKCLWPLAHKSERAQREFVNNSIWSHGAWRSAAGNFLATYFHRALDQYYAPSSRPCEDHPEFIHDEGCRNDYRGWTVELRVLTDLSLRELQESRRLVGYYASPSTLKELLEDGIDTGLDPGLSLDRLMDLHRAEISGVTTFEERKQSDRFARKRDYLTNRERVFHVVGEYVRSHYDAVLRRQP